MQFLPTLTSEIMSLG